MDVHRAAARVWLCTRLCRLCVCCVRDLPPVRHIAALTGWLVLGVGASQKWHGAPWAYAHSLRYTRVSSVCFAGTVLVVFRLDPGEARSGWLWWFPCKLAVVARAETVVVWET